MEREREREREMEREREIEERERERERGRGRLCVCVCVFTAQTWTWEVRSPSWMPRSPRQWDSPHDRRSWPLGSRLSEHCTARLNRNIGGLSNSEQGFGISYTINIKSSRHVPRWLWAQCLVFTQPWCFTFVGCTKVLDPRHRTDTNKQRARCFAGLAAPNSPLPLQPWNVEDKKYPQFLCQRIEQP